jgi:hypothetical protein
LINLGVGGVMMAAAVWIIRWYANLASTGETTWSTRLDQLQDDFDRDRIRWEVDFDNARARWDLERQSHDQQIAALKARHDREVAALRVEMERDRAACYEEIAALQKQVAELLGE